MEHVHNGACSRLSVSGEDRKSEPATSGISGERDQQGGKRPGGETGSPLLVQCVMRRRTATSAPSALPVQLMAAKNSPLNKPEMTFSVFIFKPPVTSF